MRWLIAATLLIAALSTLGWYCKNEPAHKKKVNVKTSTGTGKGSAEYARLKSFAAGIKVFAKKQNYNTRYCFLMDTKITSGSNRFFVYDIKYDSILDAGLVAHGSGLVRSDSIIFSNNPGSNCTSLGKYKIGKPYNGSFGLAYKLYGLDKTNSNAFNRFVVLHAHRCVPAAEISPGEICQSWGCPTVAPSFLSKLAGYIDNSEKPMLLWIFN
jgi:hypothetical protein